MTESHACSSFLFFLGAISGNSLFKQFVYKAFHPFIHFYVRRDMALGGFPSCVVFVEDMDVVYAGTVTYPSHLVCSVGGGRGVPDADKISARPRKWMTSNAALATSGPREQEEARLLSKGSCSSSVHADDPAVR